MPTDENVDCDDKLAANVRNINDIMMKCDDDIGDDDDVIVVVMMILWWKVA